MKKDLVKIVGIGLGGGNIVNSLFKSNLFEAEFYYVDTDLQVLEFSNIPNKVQIGEKFTNGVCTAGDISVGQKAAEDDINKLSEIIKDAQHIIIVACLGGGTGGGATPVFAKIAKEQNKKVSVIVTTPFEFCGERRPQKAQKCIKSLKDLVDDLKIISNEEISKNLNNAKTLSEIFKAIDDEIIAEITKIINR